MRMRSVANKVGRAIPRGETAALAVLVVCGLFSVAPVRAEFTSPEEGNPFFEEKIRPVLAEKCYSCHSADAEKLKGVAAGRPPLPSPRGRDTGPSLVPGKRRTASSSRPSPTAIPICACRRRRNFPPPWSRIPEMDRGRRAMAEEPVPRPGKGEPLTGKAPRRTLVVASRRETPEAPAVKDAGWARTVRSMPSSSRRSRPPGCVPPNPPTTAPGCGGCPSILPACRRRRSRPRLSSRYLDRAPRERSSMPSSLPPHFGEKWARHWMDLVRYAETHGHEFDFPIDHAFEYRDYLIRAFNDDVPSTSCQGTHRGRPPCESAPPREGGIQRIRPRDPASGI